MREFEDVMARRGWNLVSKEKAGTSTVAWTWSNRWNNKGNYSEKTLWIYTLVLEIESQEKNTRCVKARQQGIQTQTRCKRLWWCSGKCDVQLNLASWCQRGQRINSVRILRRNSQYLSEHEQSVVLRLKEHKPLCRKLFSEHVQAPTNLTLDTSPTECFTEHVIHLRQ